MAMSVLRLAAVALVFTLAASSAAAAAAVPSDDDFIENLSNVKNFPMPTGDYKDSKDYSEDDLVKIFENPDDISPSGGITVPFAGTTGDFAAPAPGWSGPTLRNIFSVSGAPSSGTNGEALPSLDDLAPTGAAARAPSKSAEAPAGDDVEINPEVAFDNSISPGLGPALADQSKASMALASAGAVVAAVLVVAVFA